MSRSSTDVFDDIIALAQFAKEDASQGIPESAMIRLPSLRDYLEEAHRRLKYELQCKAEIFGLLEASGLLEARDIDG